MNREDFIKIIPKPTNEEVIIYDISLKDLIDVDVLSEYNKLLPVFKESRNKFIKLKKEIEVYTETINQVFLFNPSWSEEIYLQKLQEDMKTYSTLYGDIKKKEDEIKILQKKIDATNEKIVIQKNKEAKEDEIRNININNQIEEDKINSKKFKDVINVYKDSLKRIEQQIKNLKTDLQTLQTSRRQLIIGTYTCFCCGKKIKENETGKIRNRIENNIQKYTEQLNSALEEKSKIQNTLNYYKDELSEVKIRLQNNLSLRSNYKRMYVKKSIEILKLEALKNEYLNKITKANQELKNEPQTNSKKILELKNRIEKYKVSLENLKKIRNMKANIVVKTNTYKEKENQLKEMQKTLNKYLYFLKIFYKIYEQKASQYAGQDYKIKFFEIKNYDIIKILNIKYKGIEYSELSKKDKKIVDENLLEKFSSDF